MCAKKNSKGTLESSLKRLEEIVESLENGEVSLDDALSLYEEGINISKACAEKLKNAELKIRKLSKDVEKQFEEEE
jgi:exodeoxyribonuclease VII small subunit